MRCPRCNSNSWREFVTRDPWAYVSCLSCSLTRIDPFPGRGEAAALYHDDYFQGSEHGGYADYARDERVHRYNAEQRMKYLGRPPRPGAVLVDVGAASGYTLDAARQLGWTPIGVEINNSARAAIEAQGFEAVSAIDELGPGRDVAAVTFFQSLEHLTDPVASLTAARAILQHPGQLVIETWNRQSWPARLSGRHWQQINPPTVLWLFGRDDLTDLLSRAGFTTTSYRPSTKRVSVGLVMGVLATGQGRSSRLLDRIAKVPLPYFIPDLITATAVTRVS